jgi:hypothetical protein
MNDEKEPHLGPSDVDRDEDDELPRSTLRYKAFRRYEQYIALAQQQQLTIVNPKTMGITPATFIRRFRDAILGLTRYSYPSETVKTDYNFKHIRLAERKDGSVKIINDSIARAEQLQGLPQTAEEALKMSQGGTRTVNLMRLSKEQMDKFCDWIRELNDRKLAEERALPSAEELQHRAEELRELEEAEAAERESPVKAWSKNWAAKLDELEKNKKPNI